MTAVYAGVAYPAAHEDGMPDYLLRLGYNPSPDSPYPAQNLACDYAGCFAEDYEDIINGTSHDLRPIYLDTRHDVRICRDCVAVGKHLDDGEKEVMP